MFSQFAAPFRILVLMMQKDSQECGKTVIDEGETYDTNIEKNEVNMMKYSIFAFVFV